MTHEREAELAVLNENIKVALSAREQWYRDNLLDLADFKIGDRIYAKVAANDYRLQYAGIVREIYLGTKRGGCPCILYRFDRDESYHYSNDTCTDWASFHPHSFWVAHTKAKIARLQEQL